MSPQAVVGCACDALTVGPDSPSLRILAGPTRSEAAYHLLELLPAAPAELGLDFYPHGGCGGREAAAGALAAQAVSGSLARVSWLPRSTGTSCTACRWLSAWQPRTTSTTSAHTAP